MKKSTTKIFLVLQRIWSVQHQDYFDPGAVVEFDPAKENYPAIEQLAEQGVLTEITAEQAASIKLEIQDATNSTDSTANID